MSHITYEWVMYMYPFIKNTQSPKRAILEVVCRISRCDTRNWGSSTQSRKLCHIHEDWAKSHMHHVIYEWVRPIHKRHWEASMQSRKWCHICQAWAMSHMSHVTYEWVMSHTQTSEHTILKIMSRAWRMGFLGVVPCKACHIWINHVP